jgi:hypothetical protein
VQVIGLALAALAAAAAAEPPHLRREGTVTRLVVDGAPFLVLGGELGNSTGEPAYLKPSWPKLEELGLNTVLARLLGPAGARARAVRLRAARRAGGRRARTPDAARTAGSSTSAG